MMNNHSKSPLLLILLMLSSNALGSESSVAPFWGVAAGWAISSGAGESDYFTYGFSQYQYDAESDTQAHGNYGGLLGLEWSFHPNYALQSALAYYYFSPQQAEGTIRQGVSLDHSTPFRYHYQITSQQLLIENKLVFPINNTYYPFLLLGLGVAFNNSEDYDIHYPADLIFTPFYEDNQNTAFSYSVGLGLDYRIFEKMRLGLSYRFSDLGRASLGQRTIDPIHPIAVSGSLEDSHLTLQQILFHLSFGL